MPRTRSMQAQARKILEITVTSFALAGATGLSLPARTAAAAPMGATRPAESPTPPGAVSATPGNTPKRRDQR